MPFRPKNEAFSFPSGKPCIEGCDLSGLTGADTRWIRSKRAKIPANYAKSMSKKINLGAPKKKKMKVDRPVLHEAVGQLAARASVWWGECSPFALWTPAT